MESSRDSHSSVGLRPDLLIHLDESTAVVDKDAVLVATLNVDAKHKVERLRVPQCSAHMANTAAMIRKNPFVTP